MSRPTWVAVLVLSLATALGGFTAVATSGPADDFGTTGVSVPAARPAVSAGDRTAAVNQLPDGAAGVPAADVPGGPDGPGATREPRATSGTRAGAAPVVPEVSRRPAALDQPAAVRAPVRVTIEDAGIRAPVDPVGVDGAGLMDIPDSGRRVGWYRYGPAPADGTGSVVLASHVDTVQEGPGVLAALSEVQEGTRVVVELSDGGTVEYRVTSRRTIAKDDLPLEQVFARDGQERLTLITCGGPWQESQRSYRDNVVVSADPVLAGP